MRKLGLLFNLTNHQRINLPSSMTVYFTTRVDRGYNQLGNPRRYAFFCGIYRPQRKPRPSPPPLAYMSHHNKEMLQEVRSEQWLSVKNNQDYLHLIEKKPGLFVRNTGCCIYEYLCVATKVPLEEISFCTCAAPDANLDSLVTTPHSEIIPCPDKFPMIIEAMKHIWVTVNRRVAPN